MKSIHACGTLLAWGAFCLTAAAQGTANYASSSLLPLPEFNYPSTSYSTARPVSYPRSAVAAWDNTPTDHEPEVIDPGTDYYPSPETSQAPYQAPHQMPGTPHQAPFVKGDIAGCSTCGTHHTKGACRGHKSHGVFHSLWPVEPRVSVYGARTGCGWFGGAGALIMTRDNDDHYYFSFGDGSEELQLLDVREAEMDWAGGFEARVGHFFNCGQNAWEVVYWGVYPGEEESILLDDNVDGFLNGILNFEDLAIDVGGAPVAVGDWVNAADAHRVSRDFDFQNVEFNIWNYSGCSAIGCRSRLQYNWGFGARYFRVDDSLRFSAKEGGSGDEFDDSTNQINYDIDVDNNLIGAQLIGNGEYFISDCWSIVLGTKVGLYANVINHRSRIYNADGVAFVNDGGPNDGLVFDVESDKDDVVMMAELNVGMNYRLGNCWTLYGGYRALGVSSLATAPGQIPLDLRGVQDVQIIDSNDDMILHGAYLGGMFNW